MLNQTTETILLISQIIFLSFFYYLLYLYKLTIFILLTIFIKNFIVFNLFPLFEFEINFFINFLSFDSTFSKNSPESQMQFSNLNESLACPIFSPCSKYIVTFNNQHIYIKDASYLDLKDHTAIGIKEKNSMPMVKFSPDSQLIALKFVKRIEIYDIQGNLKCRIYDQNLQIDNMIWSEDPGSYQLLVFYKSYPNCHIFDIQKKTTCIIKNPKYTNENGCVFSKGSHQGVFMAMLQRNGVKDSIGIYFTRTWDLVNYINLQTSFDVAKIQFSENGKLLVIEKVLNFKIFIVDMYRGVIEEYGDKNYVLGFSSHKFSNSSQFLALGAYDNCVHLLNTATWKLIAEMQIVGEVDLTKAIWFKQQGGTIYSTSGTKGKIPKKQQKQPQQVQTPPGISLLQFSPNDLYLAVKIDTYCNSVFIYSIMNLELVSVITFERNVKDFKWIEHDNGEADLCVAHGTGILHFWKAPGNEEDIYGMEIPTAQDLKITKIQQVKDRKLIFYSLIMKKFVYAAF